MPDLEQLGADYLLRFGVMPPRSFGMPEDAMAELLQRALERGTPLEDSDFPVPDSPDTAY